MRFFLRPVLEIAACLLLICLACWAAPFMPVTDGWENGPFENAQVAVLLGGFCWALFSYFRHVTPRAKAFWLSVLPVWLIMALRELSWGAVLYPPLEFSGYTGPVFSADVQLWYKPVVTPILVVMMVLSLVNFLRTRQYLTLVELFCARRIPFAELLVVVIFMIASAASEGHMGPFLERALNLHMGAEEVFEEITELFAYTTLLIAQIRLGRGMVR